MTPKQEHTPVPWKILPLEGNPPGRNGLIILTLDDVEICSVFSDGMPECEMNAAFIVRAINAHEDLLEACKRALAERIGQPSRVISAEGVEVLRQAIAKAEGKS